MRTKQLKRETTAKITALQAKAPQLQAQAAQVAGKLKPEESQQVSNLCDRVAARRCLDAMKQ